MRPMPMGTPAAMAMTPMGARPPVGPGGTPVGKAYTGILHIKLDEISQFLKVSFTNTFL